MNKKLIAILTLVMFAVTLLPMGAFAASTNTVIARGTIGDGQNETLNSTFRMVEPTGSEGVLSENSVITFTLEGGASVASAGTFEVSGFATDASPATTGELTLDVTGLSSTTFAVIVDSRTVADTARAGFQLNFEALGANVDARSASGNILLSFESDTAGITEGSVVIGQVLTGRTNVSVTSTKSVSIDSSNQEIGEVLIREVFAGSIREERAMNIKLPQDFTWSVDSRDPVEDGTWFTLEDWNTVTDLTFGAVGYQLDQLEARTADVGGRDTLQIRRIDGENPTSRGQITISGWKVDVNNDAPFGDVSVRFDGEFNTQTLVLARVVDFGVTVVEDTIEELYAGESEEKIGSFRIQEGAARSIIEGRNIRMTLPAGAMWTKVPTIERIGGTNVFPNENFRISSNGRELTIAAEQMSTTPANLRFKDAEVALTPGFEPGDLMVSITGPAGVVGEVKVAEVMSPLAVETTPANVRIGIQAQELGNVTITEQEDGIFASGETLVYALPSAWRFNGTPVVTLEEGDTRIGDVSVNGNELTIEFDRTSLTASTINISGIRVDLDRTVAEGPYNFKIYGTTVNKVAGEDTSITVADRTFGDGIEDVLSVSATDAVYTFVGATVVTPATDGVVQPVVMTVGSTIYTVGGVEMAMDVAPYIRDGRTFFPVRFVAQAVGVANDNVLWDGPSNTVTIFRGNRIVQMTIGSTTMLVNGTPVVMDVAPEITASRTMLPIRFLGQGLGLTVDWDAATQTVTLN